MKAKAQIFLSYARPDEERVKNLYEELSDVGFKPWMDKKDILPGEIWKRAIQEAIRGSDFFLACLSANSVNRRGFIQREIRDALDIWQEKLDSDIYLIPVRLEDCEVPESLREFQWVNLFERDGSTRLVKAIRTGMDRRVGVTRPIIQESTPVEEQVTTDRKPPSANLIPRDRRASMEAGEPEWITTGEASRRTGYAPNYLQQLARKRWVKARKREGKWYFDWDVLRAYMDGWIGVHEASVRTPYSDSHLRWLAREESVRAEMVNGFWLLDWQDLLAYCRDRGRM